MTKDSTGVTNNIENKYIKSLMPCTEVATEQKACISHLKYLNMPCVHLISFLLSPHGCRCSLHSSELHRCDKALLRPTGCLFGLQSFWRGTCLISYKTWCSAHGHRHDCTTNLSHLPILHINVHMGAQKLSSQMHFHNGHSLFVLDWTQSCISHQA